MDRRFIFISVNILGYLSLVSYNIKIEAGLI